MTKIADYISDVCALAVAKNVLNDRRRTVVQSRNIAAQARKPEITPDPGFNYQAAALWIPMVLIGVLALGLVLLILSVFFKNWLMGILAVIFGGALVLMLLGLIVPIWEKYETLRDNHNAAREAHLESTENYERDMERWKQMQSTIPEWDEKIALIQSEIDQVERKLDDLLSWNYIPNKYRGIYPILFLYDWFTSCQSEDMEYAIVRYEKDRDRAQFLYEYHQTEILKKLMRGYSETIEFLRGLKTLQF